MIKIKQKHFFWES